MGRREGWPGVQGVSLLGSLINNNFGSYIGSGQDLAKVFGPKAESCDWAVGQFGWEFLA